MSVASAAATTHSSLCYITQRDSVVKRGAAIVAFKAAVDSSMLSSLCSQSQNTNVSSSYASSHTLTLRRRTKHRVRPTQHAQQVNTAPRAVLVWFQLKLHEKTHAVRTTLTVRMRNDVALNYNRYYNCVMQGHILLFRIAALTCFQCVELVPSYRR